jgi:4-amino-4-deoxy-L-arabinose transferase-like glycosyltransferase
MPTAENAAPSRARDRFGSVATLPAKAPREQALAWGALAVVLAVALALRLWGVRSGLPYVYNVDEAAHFVPKAIAMSWGGLDPHYFVNPPALTYLLHAVFVVWFGGGHGAAAAFANHRSQVFLVARVVVALLGTLAAWLLYMLGRLVFEDRAIALLAAALEAVAFLPVFYGHFALNDAVALVPLTLSLLGSALVLRRGRGRDYVLAGGALGLACATKYTAGIALAPLLAAIWMRAAQAERRELLARTALAGACALGAFLIANPYALLDFSRFHADLVHQSTLTEGQSKLGAPAQGGLVYYLWSLSWGLGWAPALAALGGAVAIWRRDVRMGWLLVPAPLLFLAFMGTQDRYFGRWLLPIFPFLCLLAAYFALGAARWMATRLPGRGALAAPAAAAALALLAQGVAYSIHSDLVLAREDTRSMARTWMLAHIPRGARIVLEPIVRDEWLQEGGPGAAVSHPARWRKYPDLGPLVSSDGASRPDARRARQIEEYELTLTPVLIERYERGGYCWAISGSTQRGRAFASPRQAPWAIAYYRALARAGQLVYEATPYATARRPVGFSFDWSFDYYPPAYARPGPTVSIYRLRGGRCRHG